MALVEGRVRDAEEARLIKSYIVQRRWEAREVTETGEE